MNSRAIVGESDAHLTMSSPPGRQAARKLQEVRRVQKCWFGFRTLKRPEFFFYSSIATYLGVGW